MEIPSSFYYLVGTLIVANIGAIGSLLILGAKLVWWFAQLDMNVKKNSKDINNAFKEIKEIKNELK